MAETSMNVTLIAHTQLSQKFINKLCDEDLLLALSHNDILNASDGQIVALGAIRTCYSPLKPSEIVPAEGEKYFNREATDGKGGKESDRLFRQIFSSKHLSTVEHLTFTFAIEGVSRALLAQLTRHRVGFSFSVQSQRYVKLGTGDKSGGFDYVVPETVKKDELLEETFHRMMERIQAMYDELRCRGIPAEDARAVLPNATATNLTMTANLRALLDFYSKRRKGRGAQHEITELAERLRECVVDVEPWTDQFFEVA